MKLQIAILSIVLTAPAAMAETLILKNGAEISGAIATRKDGRVTIRVEGGEITLPESMVRETRSDTTTAATIEKAEADAKEKLAQANQTRRERMAQAAAALETARREGVEARPASLSSQEIPVLRAEARERSIEEIAATIEAKLDVLREIARQGLDRKTGFQEQQRLRRAILSELFPNSEPQSIVW